MSNLNTTKITLKIVAASTSLVVKDLSHCFSIGIPLTFVELFTYFQKFLGKLNF